MTSFDAATLLMQGQRTYQEDAVVSCYPIGADYGYSVLSDGMGGHAGGEFASKICVCEIQKTLLVETNDLQTFKSRAPEILVGAVASANAAIERHIEQKPQYAGMGATIVSAVNFDNALYWVSVGDSLLLLYRDGEIFRLNADHSMAAEIDDMVRQGKLSQADAEEHPDRSMLTSALIGKKINKIDCADKCLILLPGDVLIIASDGLRYLTREKIVETVDQFANSSSQIIAHQFKSAIDLLGHDEQDNVSMSIVKVLD